MSNRKMVTLEGRITHSINFSLNHNDYCEVIGECHCVKIKVGVKKTSKITKTASPVFSEKIVPSVLTVSYKKKTLVPEEVLQIPAIARAISMRHIRVHR